MQKNFDWFHEARFGLFLHWGVYALGARGEWQQSHEELGDEDYRKYVEYFQPDLFDPVAWAQLARAAGMKYMVITAKHHDGFCLWDSQFTDYKATAAPRCRRDLLRGIVDAFRAEGLKIGIYYSLPDWHHPNYVIDARHPLRRRPARCDFAPYTEYLHNQVRELLTHYGQVDLLWFDGSYPETEAVWDAPRLNALIRRLQPNILVNRLPGFSDFDSPEQAIPGEGVRDVAGNPLPWEGCQVFRGSAWGYSRDDDRCKSTGEVLEMLVRHVSRSGNLLLNVGPDGRGAFPDDSVNCLQGVARWMTRHNRAIHGCSGAPEEFPEPKDCRYTWNPATRTLYAHFFSWPDRRILLPGLGDKVKYAQMLHDASELRPLQIPHTNVHGQLSAADALQLELPVKRPDTPLPVAELFL